MRIDIVSLFPELFTTFLETSLVGRAVAGEIVRVRTRSPRVFGVGRHLKVDDTPYGGGSGMVMRVDCVVDCMESLDADAPVSGRPGSPPSDPVSGRSGSSVEGAERAHRVLLTPQGRRLSQGILRDLGHRSALMLVCGRYEGFDERVRSFVDDELSLGDFVLTGGEVAAMAIIEGVARLLPGVLGNEASTTEESHSPESGGLLEYPHYTRPAEFRGMTIPDVLVSGNHAEIARYRAREALERTRARRPDLLPHGPLGDRRR